MFIMLEGQQIGFSDNIRYTVHDTEFVDVFISNDMIRGRSLDERFADFLEGFYNVYIEKNKNPIPSIIKLMSHYGSFKHYAFHAFLKSKGFEKDDYEKYLVLV